MVGWIASLFRHLGITSSLTLLNLLSKRTLQIINPVALGHNYLSIINNSLLDLRLGAWVGEAH